MLNGLDLFSGIGGLTLALEPWVRPIAYCELDRYAQAILLSRMAESQLPSAPIWDDIRTLKGDCLPPIDIIYGGFPCQDISVAGLGKGLEGERSGLFFQMLRLVGEVRPTFLFLENVPAIRTRGLGAVVHSLAEVGYECRWEMLSAEEVGAPHKRERWFCLAANTDSLKLRKQPRRSGGETGSQAPRFRINGETQSLANTDSEGLEIGQSWQSGKQSPVIREGWWKLEPDVDRVVNGLPHRVDRIKGLGNSVVPAQAREAFKRLAGLQN